MAKINVYKYKINININNVNEKWKNIKKKNNISNLLS